VPKRKEREREREREKSGKVTGRVRETEIF
jgi:hypothetical protein